MTLLQILLVGITVFATHAIEAVTGFGCTVLALPFVTGILGMKAGVPLLAVLAWILALYIAISKWRSIDFRQFAIIVFFVGLGMPAGMYAFRTLDSGLLKKLLAVFIIFSSSWRLYRGFRQGNDPACPAAPAKPLPRWLSFPLLVVGGMVHGAFASGGPLVVLYAAAALPDKGRFRATLCLLWASLNTVLIIGYFRSGMLTLEFGKGLTAMAPFLVAGIVAGERLHDRMNPLIFDRVVFGTLLATGIIMLAV